jgi:putative tryptophan/tyrosine transport system substrate-binding protein
MMRRTIGLFITLALSLSSRRSSPRSGRRKSRIGMLTPASEVSTPAFEAFRQGLRELGWVEGQNLAIEWRFAEGRPDRFPALAAQLVSLPVDPL